MTKTSASLTPGFHRTRAYDVTRAMLFCSILHATAYPTESITAAERAIG